MKIGSFSGITNLWKSRLNVILPGAFRFSALAVAAIQIFSLPSDDFIVHPAILIFGAGIYSCLKVIQPVQWYRMRVAGGILLGLDIVLCLLFVMLTGGIHSPFILYTISPVILSALLLSGIATFIIVSVTAVLVLGAGMIDPLSRPPEALSTGSMFPTYLITLVMAALLPYVANLRLKQDLWSAARKDERDVIAREMHDGLCQQLYSLDLKTQTLSRKIGNSLQELKQLEGHVKEAAEESRYFLGLLRNYNCKRGLLNQINECLENLKTRSGVEYYINRDISDVSLDERVEFELLRICQEAVRNVQKHSGASKLEVALHQVNGHVQLMIADDGSGFDFAGKPARGFGLKGMAERAKRLGGHLTVTSVPGTGTRILVEVPRRLKADWT